VDSGEFGTLNLMGYPLFFVDWLSQALKYLSVDRSGKFRKEKGRKRGGFESKNGHHSL